MGLVANILSVLLALAMIGSAVGKLTGQEQVTDVIRSVGVTEERMKLLAMVQLLGAAGLLIGIAYHPLGLLAALGFVAYFAGAVMFHQRAGHGPSEFGPAAGLAVVALLTAAARAISL